MTKTTKDLNIILIPSADSTNKGGSALSNWAISFIISFYRLHIKRIPPIRRAIIRIWKVAYPKYAGLRSLLTRDRETSKWLPLVPFRLYGEPCAVWSEQLLGASNVSTPKPRVIPSKYQDYIASQEGYKAPTVTLKLLTEGTINGGSNLLQFHNNVMCHDLLNLQKDYTSEELHGRVVISVSKSKLRYTKRDPFPLRLANAASFVDACAPNYAHWLTEVLPRLAIFCSVERFSHVPIVINSGLHDNILQSIAFFAGAGREIYSLPIGRSITVEQLYVTSATGYVPFERRSGSGSGSTGHSQGCFNPAAFAKIREVIIPIALSASRVQDFSKIYIRRNSGIRKVLNSVELEEALVDRGYAIIEPEKLSFIEQVRIFADATTIIGSSGAALGNLVFANPKATVYILIGRYKETSFWYWQNIAAAVGCMVNYVLGNIEATGGAAIHADFRIDIAEFLRELDAHDGAQTNKSGDH